MSTQRDLVHRRIEYPTHCINQLINIHALSDNCHTQVVTDTNNIDINDMDNVNKQTHMSLPQKIRTH